MRHVTRGGTYYRVCDPTWTNPSDTSYAKAHGGRWNPPGAFGALYLNRTFAVALANARRHIASLFGNIVVLEDLRPNARPDLQYYQIVDTSFVDVVTPRGIAAVHLPATFPNVKHDLCQDVAAIAYAAGEAGISAISAVAPPGEELAIFDRSVTAIATEGKRERYAIWSHRVDPRSIPI